MSDAEFLLTDEYVEYTQKIAKLHAHKKTKEEEMKRLYDEFKAEMATIEDDAKKLHDEWEGWKSSQAGEPNKKPAKKSSSKEDAATEETSD